MSDSEISKYSIDPDVVAVVVGVESKFNYRKLCIATLYISMNNSIFIATNADRVYATTNPNRFMPAGGSVVKAIQAATLVDPYLIGKPQIFMFDLLR